MVAKTITLLNRLARKDNPNNVDVWYKTILHDIPYTKKSVTTVSGSVTSVGEVFRILLPFNSMYIPYHDWINGNMEHHYTINQGDYIFLNTELQETITPNNIMSIKNQNEPFVCEVKTFNEVEQKYGTKYQLEVGGI